MTRVEASQFMNKTGCCGTSLPIWRYGVAFHKLHGSAAGAVAVYDPRLGAVVVASHCPEYREGQVVDVSPENAGS